MRLLYLEHKRENQAHIVSPLELVESRIGSDVALYVEVVPLLNVISVDVTAKSDPHLRWICITNHDRWVHILGKMTKQIA